MMAVHTALTSAVLAWSIKVSCDFLLRNQISKRRPLSPTFSVIPISAVCAETKLKLSKRTSGADGKAWRTDSYLERLFVDVNVISSFDLFGLAEEDEVFKQEDMAEVLPPPAPDDELILAAELTLLFQVHLQRKQASPCVTENNKSFGGILISHRRLHNNDLRIRNSFNDHFPAIQQSQPCTPSPDHRLHHSHEWHP